MNPNNYIRKELEFNMIKSKCRARKIQRSIVKDSLTAYNRGIYSSLDDLIANAKKQIIELSLIGRGVTAEEFAAKKSISKTTARLHLLNLDHVTRDESERPFIYTLKNNDQ